MKFAKKTDFIIISVLIVASLLFWFVYRHRNDSQTVSAEIYYQSKLVKTIDLTEKKEKRFFIEQNPNVIFHTYPDGSICFEQSDCPDKICVHTGRIHLAGEYAACLPNHILVKIVENKKSKDSADIIIG